MRLACGGAEASLSLPEGVAGSCVAAFLGPCSQHWKWCFADEGGTSHEGGSRECFKIMLLRLRPWLQRQVTLPEPEASCVTIGEGTAELVMHYAPVFAGQASTQQCAEEWGDSTRGKFELCCTLAA